MVIYPFQTDQFLWAKTTGDLRVSPGFRCRPRGVTSRGLHEDLAFTLTADARARAVAFAPRLRDEDGLAVQVDLIESIVAHHQTGRPPGDWQPRRAAS
jgi:UDP:flavonoid glycosyltransferase YjiC (YdhE family)